MTYYDETQASLFVDVEGSPVGLEGSTWTFARLLYRLWKSAVDTLH